MNLTQKEIDILLSLAESFLREGYYLLEERVELKLFAKLQKNSEIEYPILEKFLETGDL